MPWRIKWTMHFHWKVEMERWCHLGATFSCRWCILKIFVPKPLAFCFQIFILQVERGVKSIQNHWESCAIDSWWQHQSLYISTWKCTLSTYVNFTPFKICEPYELCRLIFLAMTCSWIVGIRLLILFFFYKRHIILEAAWIGGYKHLQIVSTH